MPGETTLWKRSFIPGSLKDVTAVDAGTGFVVALKSDGTVVAWGRNDYGQCDVPEGLNDVVSIAAGYGHVIALKKDGSLVAWGRNNFGQCDIPEIFRSKE